ncbi:unnamed protein product, partial [Meganyctiphanes norvegica]
GKPTMEKAKKVKKKRDKQKEIAELDLGNIISDSGTKDVCDSDESDSDEDLPLVKLLPMFKSPHTSNRIEATKEGTTNDNQPEKANSTHSQIYDKIKLPKKPEPSEKFQPVNKFNPEKLRLLNKPQPNKSKTEKSTFGNKSDDSDDELTLAAIQSKVRSEAGSAIVRTVS